MIYARMISTGSFELFRIVQAVWAAVLAVLAIAAAFSGAGWLSRSGLYLLAVHLYLLASWGVFLNYRWAWAVSIAFLIGYWIVGIVGGIGGIPFTAGLSLLFAGERVYQARPLGTMFVSIHALFFVIPPVCLCVLGALSTSGIIRVLRGRPMPISDL